MKLGDTIMGNLAKEQEEVALNWYWPNLKIVFYKFYFYNPYLFNDTYLLWYLMKVWNTYLCLTVSWTIAEDKLWIV